MEEAQAAVGAQRRPGSQPGGLGRLSTGAGSWPESCSGIGRLVRLREKQEGDMLQVRK